MLTRVWNWLTAHGRPLLVVALAGLGISMCVYFATQSASYRQCESGREATSSNEKTKNFFDVTDSLFVCEGVTIDNNGELLTAIATVALAAFTLTLWLTSRRQAELTIIAIDDARIASRRELRAYVSSLPLRAALAPGDRAMIVVVETENTGRTPAFRTQVLWDMRLMEYPLTAQLVFHGHADDAGKPVPTFVTYPRAKHMGVKTFELTHDVLTRVRAKTHAIYVFGRVTYVDAFNDPQWGEFCSYIDGEFLDVWLREATASEGRRPVAAPFKFTQSNNTASFS